eukprot:5512807-Pyramimonas_sp.AAC.1
MVQDCQGATFTLVRKVNSQEWYLGTVQDRQDATARLDSWCRSHESGVLVRVRIFKRLSTNGALPSVEMNLCRGLGRGNLEG